MADEVADSLATLNDVTDRGVPYRRMGGPLPTADRPYVGRIQLRSPAVPVVAALRSASARTRLRTTWA